LKRKGPRTEPCGTPGIILEKAGRERQKSEPEIKYNWDGQIQTNERRNKMYIWER
jgi:hypothetical protein